MGNTQAKSPKRLYVYADTFPHVCASRLLKDFDPSSGEEPLHPPCEYYQLCDFILTTLHNFNGHPNAVELFFDPEVVSFKLCLESSEGSLMVWRVQNEVFDQSLIPASVRLLRPSRPNRNFLPSSHIDHDRGVAQGKVVPQVGR
jgi:hypothetical protein